jgi:hypothetical protein
MVFSAGGGREMAYRAAMKSDLKNLASQEEIYFSDNDGFSADPTALQFVSSNGVNVTLVAAPGGWAARASHEALGEQESCALAFGDEVAHGFELLEDAAPGQLVCTL